MPIYEFYCENCNTIFNFFSSRINTKKVPGCPKCKNGKLSRLVSVFSYTGGDKRQTSEDDDISFDESKMEKAMQMLVSQAESIDENDPRKAADVMRRFSNMAGMELGGGMEEALKRMENGEDPEKIEAEMGDQLEGDGLFAPAPEKGKSAKYFKLQPYKDETLYDL